MAGELVSLTTRIDKAQLSRMLNISAATGTEVSRSDIVRLALDLFFAQLSVCPSMLPGYDPKKDKSLRQKKKGACEAARRKTDSAARAPGGLDGAKD